MPLFRKKAKGEKKEESSKMPLFRRQSEKGRKRQQDQELLAQQDPEPRFDLSACELTEVPSGVYAICKVLQKQVLLLYDNWLHGLGGGGDVTDLSTLKVLDLHNNELKSLPEEMSCLDRLEVLNVAGNKLKNLPSSFGQLKSLQTLNLRKNRFKTLPETICDLKYLRMLDISQNEIDTLPVKLCFVKSLETLVLEADKMIYPTPETCKKSTAAIMMSLCADEGIEFEHPSKYWLKVQGLSKGLSVSTSDQYLHQLEWDMSEGVQAYQSVLDQKRKDAENLEKLFHAEREAQAELAAKAADNHHRLLASITQNNDDMTKDLEEISHKKDVEREELLKYLTEVENGVGNLLSQLLDYNAKAKETEELMEIMEEERMKEDDWFTVRWEELQNVRKQEVLDAMKVMLTEFADIETARQVMQSDKDVTRKDALELETLAGCQVESLMCLKDVEHKEMVANLAKQDELQKAAFEALMYSQDSAHQRIRAQITLIEGELAQLTALEMDKRTLRMEHEFNVVADQRVALSAMLSQLLEEKEKRQGELKKRLIEMEQQREDGQADYWLVQYQRLLDWKPQALIDRESQLEIAVRNILVAAGAQDYIPLFSRHRITIETLLTLTNEDLKQMGVHEMGLRKSILKHVAQQDIQIKTGEEKVREKIKEPLIASLEVHPTAPEAPEQPPPIPPALIERQASVTARGINSECAVCLDRQSSIIFLPCGHVCCCGECSRTLEECPLCRAEIKVKVKLTLPQ